MQLPVEERTDVVSKRLVVPDPGQHLAQSIRDRDAGELGQIQELLNINIGFVNLVDGMLRLAVRHAMSSG